MHWRNFLLSRRTLHVLLVLNGVATIGVFIAFRNALGGDYHSYVDLADGILHGNYSMWWFLPVNIPDTFRNPGYPLFLTPFRYLTKSVLPVQIAQLLLYAGSVLLSLKIIRQLGGGIAACNLFLLILLPSINLPYYNTTIFPEIPCMFVICAFVWTDLSRPDNWKKGVLLALLAGAVFQLRSPMLLFPIAWLITRFLFTAGRTNRAMAAMFFGLYALTLLPFSLWNLNHHGVFKPTPLEGGGGVAHMGWWSGKFPGHTEHWYWGNEAGSEMLEFTNVDSIPRNIALYDAEWAGIYRLINPQLTNNDTIMLRAHQEGLGLFKTYSTAYVQLREKLLLDATLNHVLAEPGYTLYYKTYSALRLWITGIQMDEFHRAPLRGKLVQVYPFLLTFFIFLLAIITIPWAFFKDRRLMASSLPLVVWLVYFGTIHIPFVIQARYTIPVRPLLFILVAICIERLWGGLAVSRENPTPSDQVPLTHDDTPSLSESIAPGTVARRTAPAPTDGETPSVKGTTPDRHAGAPPPSCRRHRRSQKPVHARPGRARCPAAVQSPGW